MPGWAWAIVIAAAIVVVALVVWQALKARRTRTPQDRFGPEYERAVAQTDDRVAYAVSRGVAAGAGAVRRRPERGGRRGRLADPVGDARAGLPGRRLRPARRRRGR